MSLTRFLPTPSDRMGILWTLLNIDGSVIIEYGPAGTTHFSMGLFGELGIEQENRLFTTHMREEDVIMGDTSRLENAIVEVDQNFAPKVIFVVASSSSAVIGTDLRGVCKMVQPKVSARLIAFEQGGFRGDYSFGIKAAYELLAQSLAVRGAEHRPGTYNILGASSGAYRCKADAYELQRLMSETFSMRCLCPFCLETTVDCIESMSGAEINLVIRQEALPVAQLLEKQFGIPYVFGAPYGYQKTSEWLDAIAEKLGRVPNPKVIGPLKKSATEMMQYRMYARIATPLIDGSQVAHHMPLIGPRGADMIREAVDEYVNTLR